MVKIREDLTGRQYGHWIVLGYAESRHRDPLWRCCCTLCGIEYVVYGKVLTRGTSTCCRPCSQRARNKVPVPVRSEISDLDVVWLAGYLEGEGSFISWVRAGTWINYRISVNSVDKDVIEHVASIMKSNYTLLMPQEEHYQVQYRVTVTGPPAIEWMKILYEHMGIRRKAVIKVCIELFEK